MSCNNIFLFKFCFNKLICRDETCYNTFFINNIIFFNKTILYITIFLYCSLTCTLQTVNIVLFP